MNALAHYRKLRTFHFDANYGIHANQPRAAACWRLAKKLERFDAEWTMTDDGYVKDDGTMRIRVLPDNEPYDAGDTFDPRYYTPPGGVRTVEAREKAFWARIERDGVWGFIIERKEQTCNNPSHAEWVNVDSCWGFDDRDYCVQEAISAAT